MFPSIEEKNSNAEKNAWKQACIILLFMNRYEVVSEEPSPC